MQCCDRHPTTGELSRSPGVHLQMVNNSVLERKLKSIENPLAGFTLDFVSVVTIFPTVLGCLVVSRFYLFSY